MSYPSDYSNGPEPGGFAGIANGMGLVALSDIPEELSQEDRDAVIVAGGEFAKEIGDKDPCLVIAGQFTPLVRASRRAENQVMKNCMDVFGYPNGKMPQDQCPARLPRRLARQRVQDGSLPDLLHP